MLFGGCLYLSMLKISSLRKGCVYLYAKQQTHEMTHTEIQLILAGCTTALGLYLAFFKSYFSEKGKNIATQEDIGKITKTVEEVKVKFASDTEYLKNRLNLFSQNFHSIKSLERDALIQINTKYSEWLHTLTTFSLAYYTYNNFELLDGRDLLFAEKQKEFEVAEDNLHIYMHDEKIRSILLEMAKYTRELQGSIIMHIIPFMTNCSHYNYDRKNATIEKEIQLNTEYHEKQQPIIDNSLKALLDIHKKISEYQIPFLILLNKRIYQLIEE